MKRRKALKLVGLAGSAILFPQMYLRASLRAVVNNPIWENACNNLGKFAAERYQFRYIEPIKNLPKVFIYGDSISIGYTEYVRQSLFGKACVYRLHKNGGASTDFIRNMEALRKGMFKPFLKGGWDFDWDLIHFNVGLHDLKYLYNRKLDKVNGKQVSSLATYAENLEEIIKYLKATYPKAKLIFATTTPVPEGEPGRFAGDAKRYNEVARQVLKNHKDVEVNDLYQFSLSLMEKHAQSPGNVHYTPEGSRLQGIEVAKVIADELGIETVECPSSKTIIDEIEAYGKAIRQKQEVIIH